MIVRFATGIVIGIFSSTLGVASDVLVILTMMLIFAINITITVTLSLAMSGLTIIIGSTKPYR